MRRPEIARAALFVIFAYCLFIGFTAPVVPHPSTTTSRSSTTRSSACRPTTTPGLRRRRPLPRLRRRSPASPPVRPRRLLARRGLRRLPHRLRPPPALPRVTPRGSAPSTRRRARRPRLAPDPAGVALGDRLACPYGAMDAKRNSSAREVAPAGRAGISSPLAVACGGVARRRLHRARGHGAPMARNLLAAGYDCRDRSPGALEALVDVPGATRPTARRRWRRGGDPVHFSRRRRDARGAGRATTACSRRRRGHARRRHEHRLPGARRASWRRTAADARGPLPRRARLRRRRRRPRGHALDHGRRRGGGVERARPLLDVLGARVTHCGPAGAGQVVKACNQVLVAVIFARPRRGARARLQARRRPGAILDVLSAAGWPPTA